MTRSEKTKSRKLITVYRIELVVVMILILLLLCGGLYAILRSPGSGPLFRIGGENSPVLPETAGASEPSVFSGIGRLRIPVAGRNGAATLVLSIAFPYPADDRAFTEELASKITNFRTAANEYFSSLPANTLANLGEESAKTELLARYNDMLRLGKIETLYFGDFMILE